MAHNGNTTSSAPAHAAAASSAQSSLEKTDFSLALSAPGKALLAGGYLVLDPAYDSYVTALSSRMHAAVRESGSGQITVRSPQFANGEWTYVIEDRQVTETHARYNPFLECAIATVVAYLGFHRGLDITIFSDPGFHTQDSTTAKTSRNGAKRFLYHAHEITSVAKTGLGSSASLTTVVVASIMAVCTGKPVQDQMDIIHNLAQVAHCKAQKKIGSGFDVAAAVYGSIKYRRFDPSPVNKYLTESTGLRSLVDTPWDFVHQACSLPPGIRLLMGDIKGGSETPKLVGKVLAWKAAQPKESAEVYANLNSANLSLIESLERLHRFHAEHREQYLQGLTYLRSRSASSADLNSELQPFLQLIEAIAAIRAQLQTLTRLSGADIEPESQTVLLDHCSALPGCLGGVVPGAGGFDAVSLLVISDAVDDLIAAAQAQVPQVTWLDLKEEATGLQLEPPIDYIF